MSQTEQSFREKYVDENIEPFRQVADELGDLTYAHLKKVGFSNDLGDPIEFIQQKLGSSDLPSDCRNTFDQYLQFSNTVPDWVDFDRMNRGREVFLRFSPLATNVMFLAGLIGSYSASKGVKVLVATGRLKSDIMPRLYETTQMVSNALQHDALRPGNIGHRTMLKVRLMHCGVREFILNKKDWNPEWGHPVNQEDMCGTLTLFSYVVLQGLETMGIHIPERDKEDYIHLWRYAGYLLGCDEFFIPPTFAETEAIYSAIRRRQINPDHDSRALVHAVIEAVERQFAGRLRHGRLFTQRRATLSETT